MKQILVSPEQGGLLSVLRGNETGGLGYIKTVDELVHMCQYQRKKIITQMNNLVLRGVIEEMEEGVWRLRDTSINWKVDPKLMVNALGKHPTWKGNSWKVLDVLRTIERNKFKGEKVWVPRAVLVSKMNSKFIVCNNIDQLLVSGYLEMRKSQKYKGVVEVSLTSMARNYLTGGGKNREGIVRLLVGYLDSIERKTRRKGGGKFGIMYSREEDGTFSITWYQQNNTEYLKSVHPREFEGKQDVKRFAENLKKMIARRVNMVNGVKKYDKEQMRQQRMIRNNLRRFADEATVKSVQTKRFGEVKLEMEGQMLYLRVGAENSPCHTYSSYMSSESATRFMNLLQMNVEEIERVLCYELIGKCICGMELSYRCLGYMKMKFNSSTRWRVCPKCGRKIKVLAELIYQNSHDKCLNLNMKYSFNVEKGR